MQKFCEKHIKKSKLKYYSKYFEQYSSDGRKQWNMINQLLNRKRKHVSIDKLIIGHETITNQTKITESINNYFCNIALKLKTRASAEPYLDPHKRCMTNLELSPTTPHEIKTIINSFENKSTADTSIAALKHVNSMTTIPDVLSGLINDSLQQGVFPSNLKCAKVIPLHKSGSRTDMTNYRPISLLPVFSKIYERVMYNRLSEHFKQTDTINNLQFGFRPGHSCEHAILTAQNNILYALDRSQIALLLLIDFSKAFDMVDHLALLQKLEHYGVRNAALNWLQTYLHDRTQYVKLRTAQSAPSQLKYGVPQGSILGPLLFLIYINDLPEISSLAKFIFFADDANVIITGSDITEIKRKLEIILQKLENWVDLNGLKMNLKKTKYMIFSNRRDIEDIDIRISNTKIERTYEERFLGVIMDSKLSWNAHRQKLASKLSQNAGILQKLKNIVPQKVVKLLYNSFVQSHLYYCPTVWGLCSKSSLNKIFSSQKKAMRVKYHKLR